MRVNIKIFSLLSLLAIFGSPIITYAATTTDSIIVNLIVDGDGISVDPPDPPSAFSLTVNVIPGVNSVTVVWTTTKLSTGTVTWDPGSTITDSNPLLLHQTFIANIIPGVVYQLTVNAVNSIDPLETDIFTGTFSIDDLTPPANPLQISATHDSADEDVDLEWQNPPDPDFSLVRIMRSTTFFPQDEEEGELVYEGDDEFFEDTNISSGVTYYYTIFARDENGNWSSGSVDDVTIPQELPCQDDCPPSPCEGEDCEICVGDECNNQDPFDQFPLVTTVPPGFENLEFTLEQGDLREVFRDGATISLNGMRDTYIWIDYDKLPEVLKTIGVTLVHPLDPNKRFSFLLQVNGNKTRYESTIAPLLTPGTYKVFITILDHKNQKIKRVSGFLRVVGGMVSSPIITAIRKFVAPIGQAVGVAAGLTQTVVVVSNVKSLYDVYLLLVRMIGALLGFLGLRKKRQPWGTVYDSVTKRPLDPAYVTVMQERGDEIADAITDLDGRYGFLLPGGVYKIKAAKTNYEFPSKKLAGHANDELYDNLYYGEPIAASTGELLVKNIPLDPVGFDWNEFVKNQRGLFRLQSRRESFKALLFNGIYVLGFLSTLFAIAVSPTALNFSILTLYVLLFVFQFTWRRRHKAVRIVDKTSGEVFPYAIVRVYTAELSQQVKAVVADEFGRFFMLVSPGRYYITVEAKQADGSYKKVYTSPPTEWKRGVINKDIVLNKVNEPVLTGLPA